MKLRPPSLCAHGLLAALVTGMTWALGSFTPPPAIAAERIRLALDPLQITISVASLEQFAKTGVVNRDLAPFVKRLDPTQREQLRQLLTKKLPITPVVVSRATYSPMAESFLRRIGLVIQQDQRINGFYALRAAALLAASDPNEGLTPLNFLRQFPGRDIQIDIRTVLYLLREYQTQSAYRDAAVKAIAAEAERESANQPSSNFSQLPDLRQPGPFKVTKKTVTFTINAVRPTKQGIAPSYPLLVDFYLPENVTQAPLVVYTHGFGATRDNNDYILEHLASHGIAVAAPEHIGSDLQYRADFLKGEVSDILSPIEFVSRAFDTTYLLDELEKRNQNDPEWKGLFNLEQVGVMGASFGGMTALGLAGAEINSRRLEAECEETIPIFTLSPLLQCYAQYLPPTNYTVRDPRIKATFAAYPLAGAIYGPEGMAKVETPTLILSGSHDILMSPAVDDQIHPFVWMQNVDKYLALMVPGTHFSSSEDQNVAGLPELFKGPDLATGRNYHRTLAVAFFKAYLTGDRQYLPYLSQTYANTISQPTLELDIVRELTPEQLTQAYGRTPPKPIIPPPVTATSARRESVLDEIRRTRVLKVAVRSDAPPFGYLDAKGQWTGYCIDAIDALRSQVETQLNLPDRSVEVVRLPVSQDNALSLLPQGSAHIECGPNPIIQSKTVDFSEPFFISGTQLLVSTTQPPTPDITSIGVFNTNTTAIAKLYPQAQLTPFSGTNASGEALQQLQEGRLDAIADAGILLLGQLTQRGAALDQFSLIPDRPLDCQFYGFALPGGENRWQDLVNGFIRTPAAIQVRDRWFQNPYKTTLSTLDYCSQAGR